MNHLSPLEKRIFNDGERLIPGIAPIGEIENIRHKSSYEFFKKVIERDRRIKSDVVSILDYGCGVGHGSKILSEIPHSHITGVDISQESIEYAREHYSAENISYQIGNDGRDYDYIIARGVFEHMPLGVGFALSSSVFGWRERLMLDVPYDEPVGNTHHVWTGIREENFVDFPNAELFYEDINGVIFDFKNKPPNPNMIMCICSNPETSKVEDYNIGFPVPAWELTKEKENV
ncbi:MAG: class I SAM-dependent methyltransferase [Planctomycetota bacterium]